MTESQEESEPTRRLGGFIRSNEHALISDWMAGVETLSPAKELSRPVLVDHLPQILARIADMIEAVHTGARVPLSQGPKRHAVDRLARGFDLEAVIREYTVLRQCIFARWESEVGSSMTVSELRQLDAALDQSITESCVSFSQARERILKAVDRISEAAFGTTNLDEFLHTILLATVETTEAVDTAAVLLRESDVLRMRAAVGLEEEVAGSFTLEIGQGFAGKIAATRQPIIVRHAATDPLVQSAIIREKGVRALYGIPLVHADAVLGVAYIGSRTAFEFSDEDKLLFRTMASRATGVILHAQLVIDLEKAIADLERREESFHFLSEVSRELSDSIDYEKTLNRIARLAIPALADWISIELLENDELRSTLVSHSDPIKAERAKELRLKHPMSVDSPDGVAKVLRTGEHELYTEIREEQLAGIGGEGASAEVLRDLGMASAMIAPLKTRGHTFGAITFFAGESRRPYDSRDVAVAQGLAERAASTLENARLFREAERAIRVRDDVMAIVSHDLRNPLGAISLSAALLFKKFGHQARARRPVETIQRASARMARLISDLMDMASVQGGGLSVEPSLQEMGPIVLDAIHSAEPLAVEKSIRLSSEIALENQLCIVDRDRLLQLFSNLLGNAIKFCPEGGSIVVRARITNGEIECAVSDDGPGIPASELPHIFDRYWSAKQHGRQGVGLGLFIGKAIVEAHGGRIWAESVVGAGTTITFKLPLATR